MRVARTVSELRHLLQPLRGRKTIAFVPTMGCLHAGHMSLIEKANALADVVVVSIYINPLQFGPAEDLDAYPRTFEDDARACAEAGAYFIFHPTSLYADNGPCVTLKAAKLCDCLCGASRPGHFDGVLTVVNILFNIVQPDIAVFGEKDWQQLTIIRRMVKDLRMPIEIVSGAIIRDADGLAMSSRNRYLCETERRQALAVPQALTAMRQCVQHGETNAETLKRTARQILADAGIEAEYIDIRSARALKARHRLNKKPTRAFIAATVGKTRLIDNMLLALNAAPNSTTRTQESR